MKATLYFLSGFLIVGAAGASDIGKPLPAVILQLFVGCLVGLAGWVWDSPKKKMPTSIPANSKNKRKRQGR